MVYSFFFFFREKSMSNPLVCNVYPVKYIQTLKEMKKDVVECSSLCNITVLAVIPHRYAKNSRLYYPKIATLDSPNPDWRRILRLEPRFQTQALAVYPIFSTSRNRFKTQSGHSRTKSNPTPLIGEIRTKFCKGLALLSEKQCSAVHISRSRLRGLVQIWCR